MELTTPKPALAAGLSLALGKTQHHAAQVATNPRRGERALRERVSLTGYFRKRKSTEGGAFGAGLFFSSASHIQYPTVTGTTGCSTCARIMGHPEWLSSPVGSRGYAALKNSPCATLAHAT